MKLNIRKNIDRRVDFSIKENIVLDVLLRLKMSNTIGKIAKESGLPWSTTAFVLKNLEKRRMVIKVPKKTKLKHHFLWRIKRIPPTRSIESFLSEKKSR